tara:strand:- start:247 stop:495 length:249 start_codon:yes stop_codon:yes gene_type:complete
MNNIKYKQCWYAKGLNALLSSRGYVHWVVKEPMDDDYNEGTAYFFNESEKTFGKCDFIASYKFSEAKELTEGFKHVIEEKRK